MKRKVDPMRAVLAATTEADVLRQCLDVLKLYGFPAFRQNTGAFKVGGRYIKAAFAGCSDLLAVTPVSGRWLAIEAKRPIGGRLTDDQRAFLTTIVENGGVAVVVSDSQKLVQLCVALKADPYLRYDWREGHLC